MSLNFSDFKTDEKGLIPAVVQDAETLQILMVGWMNRAAYEQTISTNLVTFWSRSRNTLWQKGESSGNVLRLVKIWIDCDQDTLLLHARPAGPTCHTGNNSCFYTQSFPDNEEDSPTTNQK